MRNNNRDAEVAAASERTREISLMDEISSILRFVWRHRKLIAVPTGCVAVGAVVYSLLAAPVYKASISLYPAMETREEIADLKEMALAASGRGRASPAVNYYTYIPQIVESRRIKKKIIERKWKTQKRLEPVDLTTFWGIDATTEHEKMEAAIRALGDLVSCSLDRESGLTTISVLMTEPQLAADIANFIGEAVSAYIQDQEANLSKKNRSFIEERLRITKAELREAEEALKKFREENRIIAESPELQMEAARWRRNVTLKQEVYITLEKQRELAMIEEVRKMPTINVLDEADTPVMREKPKRKRIVVVSTLTGFLVSLLGAYAFASFKRFQHH